MIDNKDEDSDPNDDEVKYTNSIKKAMSSKLLIGQVITFAIGVVIALACFFIYT